MKKRKDKDILRFLGMGLGLVLLGIIILRIVPDVVGRTWTFPYVIGGLFILGGTMLIIMSLCTATKTREDLVQDERSVRINEKAGYHAFWILIGTLALVQLIAMFWRLNLNYKSVSPDIFIVGMFSFVILRWYYNRRYGG
uniref:DUF2178 domain-containing protein n=1 Tax=Candidatus Methanophagaceae archaeon ANME-1 ERB6 TaxID=2759912 RepID=A0A7G9YVV2_9EURY|nr:hypothetical protein MDNCFBIC_00006 [Methanosarcinales archaeon ANME-1 ERB6]